MHAERRRTPRCPAAFYVDQYIDDEAYRCFTSNLSEGGLYMERVLSPLHRTQPIVQLDVSLPGCTDTIWASGQVMHDHMHGLFHGSAVRFVAMAQKHKRLLRDYLLEQQLKENELESVALPSGRMVHIRRPAGRRPPVRRSRLLSPRDSAEHSLVLSA